MITSQQRWPNASRRQIACLRSCKNAPFHVEMTAPSRLGPNLRPAPQIVKQPGVEGDRSQVRCAFHSLVSDKGCTPELSNDNRSCRRRGNYIRSLCSLSLFCTPPPILPSSPSPSSHRPLCLCLAHTVYSIIIYVKWMKDVKRSLSIKLFAIQLYNLCSPKRTTIYSPTSLE